MIFGTGSSLAIRGQHKRKASENLAVVFAGAVCALMLSSLFLYLIRTGWVPMLLCDAAIIVLALYAFDHLEERSIGFDCTRCRRRIEANTPWVCGFCSRENRNVPSFSFAHRCEHCKGEPKAYKCHHNSCGELNFLTEDRLEAGYARCVTCAPEPEPPDPADEKRRKRKERMEAKQDGIALAELDAKLKTARQKVKPLKPKAAKDRMREEFDSYIGELFGAEEIAEAELAALERDPALKNDPARKEQRRQAILAWARRNIS